MKVLIADMEYPTELFKLTITIDGLIVTEFY
jgi:hypothetical protein